MGRRASRAGSAGRQDLVPAGKACGGLATLPEALVRPGIGSAFVPEELGDKGDAGALALAERVRAAFDPAGTLV